MKMTKTFLYPFLIVLLTLVTAYSALSAEGNIVEAYWAADQEDNISVAQGDAPPMHLKVLSAGNNVYLSIKLYDAEGTFLRNIIERFTAYENYNEGNDGIWEGDQRVATAGLVPGQYQVEVRALDWNGITETVQLTLQVTPATTNHAPTFTLTPEPQYGDFGAYYEFTVGDNINLFVDGRDADGDYLTYNQAEITAELPAGVTTRFLPNGAQQNDLQISGRVRQAGTFSFLVTVSDGELTYTRRVTLVVHLAGVAEDNHAPTFTFIPEPDDRDFGATYVYEPGELILIFVDGRDQDNDYLTYNQEEFAPELPAGVTSRFAPNGAQQNDLWFVGRAEEEGTYHFDITVSDGELEYTAPITFVIEAETVPVENVGPVMTAVPDREVDEGEALRFTVSATDTDPLTFEVERQRTAWLFTYWSNGLVRGMDFNEATGELTFTPDFDFVDHPELTREVQLRFRAFDGEESSAWEYVTVQVNDVNRDPVLTATIPPEAAQDTVVSFTSSATDADGDAVTYSWDFGDGSTSTQQNPTHLYRNTGSYTVTVTVRDAFGGSASQSGTLTIGVPNEICFNGVDDDRDGLMDCADPDCGPHPACMPGPEAEDVAVNRLKIQTVHLTPEVAGAGEYITFNVRIFNNGEKDLRDMRVVLTIPDLNVRVSSSEFDLDEGDGTNELLFVQLPEDAWSGDYLVKITAQNSQYHDTAYRQVTVR